jgi:hypothetical protein
MQQMQGSTYEDFQAYITKPEPKPQPVAWKKCYFCNALHAPQFRQCQRCADEIRVALAIGRPYNSIARELYMQNHPTGYPGSNK